MERLTNVLNFWTSNVDFLMPVLLSITILGLALGIAGLFKDNLIRTLVILPAAVILYGMGWAASPFGTELFFNLSAELLTALMALVIVLIYEIFEGWASTLAIVALVALVLLFFMNPERPQANLFVNLSTGLVGSFLIVGLLRREWDFSPENRAIRLQTAMRESHKAAQEAEAQMGDFFLLIFGRDEDTIVQKIDFLKTSNIDVMADKPIAHDDPTQLYYQFAGGKIITIVKEEETVFLNNQEARLRLLAYPDTVKRVYKQVQEVLEASELKSLEAPDNQLKHIEFKVQSPKVLFSDYIEEQIMLLARNWRHGDEAHLVQATDDLLAWAHEMDFIKD